MEAHVRAYMIEVVRNIYTSSTRLNLLQAALLKSATKASVTHISFLLDKMPNRDQALLALIDFSLVDHCPLDRLLLLDAEFGSEPWERIEFKRFVAYGSRTFLEQAAAHFYPDRSLADLISGCHSISIEHPSVLASPEAVAYLRWLYEESGQEDPDDNPSFLSLALVDGAISAKNLPLMEFLLTHKANAHHNAIDVLYEHVRSLPNSDPNPALAAFLSRPQVKERLLDQLRGVSADANVSVAIPTLRSLAVFDDATLDELEKADAERKRAFEERVSVERLSLRSILRSDDPDRFEAAIAHHQANGNPLGWSVSALITNRCWRILRRVKERNLANLEDPSHWDGVRASGLSFDLPRLRACILRGFYPPLSFVNRLLDHPDNQDHSSRRNSPYKHVAFRLLERHAHVLGYNEETLLGFKQKLGLVGTAQNSEEDPSGSDSS